MNITTVRAELAALLRSQLGNVTVTPYGPSGGVEGPAHVFLTFDGGEYVTMGRKTRTVRFGVVVLAPNVGDPGDAERVLDRFVSDGRDSLATALMDIDVTAAGSIDGLAVTEVSEYFLLDIGDSSTVGVKFTVDVIGDGA